MSDQKGNHHAAGWEGSIPEHVTSPLFSWLEMMQLQSKLTGFQSFAVKKQTELAQTKELLKKTREELEELTNYCESLSLQNRELEHRLTASENLLKETSEKLAYQTEKHHSWKSLAMSFHDAVWELMDRYVL